VASHETQQVSTYAFSVTDPTIQLVAQSVAQALANLEEAVQRLQEVVIDLDHQVGHLHEHVERLEQGR
jgi:hypothetical protein